MEEYEHKAHQITVSPRRTGKMSALIEEMEQDISRGKHVHYHGLDVYCSLDPVCEGTTDLHEYIKAWHAQDR